MRAQPPDFCVVHRVLTCMPMRRFQLVGKREEHKETRKQTGSEGRIRKGYARRQIVDAFRHGSPDLPVASSGLHWHCIVPRAVRRPSFVLCTIVCTDRGMLGMYYGLCMLYVVCCMECGTGTGTAVRRSSRERNVRFDDQDGMSM